MLRILMALLLALALTATVRAGEEAGGDKPDKAGGENDEGKTVKVKLPDGTIVEVPVSKLKIKDSSSEEETGHGGVSDSAMTEYEKTEWPDFRKIRNKIRTHQDWVDEYKKTYDYRIFYFLASRAGRVIDTARAKQLSVYLKTHPDELDTVLENWGIAMDVEKYIAEERKKWEDRYGENTLIFETDHYLILGTKKNEHFLEYLELYQEKAYAYYQKFFKSKEKTEGRFLVMIFDSRQDYITIGLAPQWSAAYFSASKRALVGYVGRMTEMYEGVSRGANNWTAMADELIHTFFHEGWHQYLHYHVPNPPIFLDEGFAQIFECLVVRGKRLKDMGFVNRDLVIGAQKLVETNRGMPVKDMVYLTIRQFQTGTSEQIRGHYRQCYSMTHMLAFGSRKYEKYYEEVFEKLMDGRDREEVLDEVYADMDWEDFESDWKKYTMKKMEAVNHTSYFKKR